MGIRTFEARHQIDMGARAAYFERAWGYFLEVLARKSGGDLAHPAPQHEAPPKDV